MSLLMEALKKAEEAKRRAGDGQAAASSLSSVNSPPASADLALTPMGPAAASASSATSASKSSGYRSPLPDLSLHGAAVDADLAAQTIGPTGSATAAGATAGAESSRKRASAAPPGDDGGDGNDSARASAHNVFAAKQPIARPRSSLPLIFAVGGLSMIVLGAYFWWQLQALSTNALAPLVPLPSAASLAAPTAASRAAPPPAPAPEPAPTTTVTATAANAAPPSMTETSPPAPAAAPTATNSIKASKETKAVRAAPASSSRARAAPASRTATAASAESPANASRPLRFSKSVPKSGQTIENAYDALLAGQFEQAQRDYEQVLRRDPKNTDALLGLATIAAHQNQNEQAHQYYLAALETDPTDATAQAGLVSTGGQSDLGRAESRLKTALGSQPESSALHFALGNVYARQSRWSEAQQAYFKAYSLEPGNADFIFNQAVSLDHLHQNRLAAQYYRMALAAADRDGIARPVAFDRQQTVNRLLELQPQ